MRIKAMWTLGNETSQKVYWGFYESSDTVFMKSWSGHNGWIEPNSAVDFEAEFDEGKIVFWEGEPTFGIGTKLGGPEKVKTDRPVVLTRDKRVVQKEPQFRDVKRVGGAVTPFDGLTENNIRRGMIIAIAGKIPKVGEAIAKGLELVWAEDKPDLIAESEARMKSWVRGVVHAYDRQQLSSHLSGLRGNLREYQNATSPGERRRWLDACLAACNGARPFFFKSMKVEDYTPGTIGLAVDVALIHLMLLRERVLFSREIFGDEAVNLEFHQKQLAQGIADYQRFFQTVAVPGELAWREREIDVKTDLGPWARYVKDWVTREVHSFTRSGRINLPQGPAQVCVDFYKAQMVSDYGRELRHNVLEPAALWALLDPARPATAPAPLDARFWAGPYAGLSYAAGNEHGFTMYDSVEQMGQRVTSIRLRVGDRIDALQIGFDGHDGRLVGNAKGGRPEEVAIPAGAMLTEIETWWDFDLWAVRFHFSDGSSSRVFGKPERGGVHQTARHPDHHVTGVRIGNRMHELYVAFSPLPDYMQRTQAAAERMLAEAERKRGGREG